MESFRMGDKNILSLNLKPFSFCYRLSKHYLKYAIPAISVVILAEIAGVSLSYIMKELVDALNEKGDDMWTWAMIYLGVYVFMEASWRSSGYLGMNWITNVRSSSANVLFEWLSKHSSKFFADRFAGSLATKVTNASNALSDMLPKFLWNFFPTFLQLILSVIIASLAKPLLGLILLIWAIAFIALNALLVPKKARLSKESATAYTKLKGQMVDILSNIRVVQQFSNRRRELQRVASCVDDQHKKIIRSWSYSEGILATNNVLQAILLGIMLVGLFTLISTRRPKRRRSSNDHQLDLGYLGVFAFHR